MNQIIKAVSVLVLITLFEIIFTPKIYAQVVINEFVPDTSLEWIEFYNASSSADYIKSYYIDDDIDFLSDDGSSSKKLLTNLNIFNPTYPYVETSSFLNNSGDWVVLFDQNGNILDKYQFSSNPGKEVSIGRYVDSSGNFSVLSYSTKGDANSVPATPSPTDTPQPTSTPSPASTPTPTRTPTPTPAKTPTPSPTKTTTPIPTPTQSPEGESGQLSSESGDVLGIEESIVSLPVGSETGPSSGLKDKNKIIAIIFVCLGMALIGISSYLAFRTSKSDKLQNDI